jgi:catechol 2,3-dioxygenase-like lactoylglutathione lyase family enzyme
VTATEDTTVEPALSKEEAAFVQVAVLVDDVDRAVEFLTAVGLGPFHVTKGVHPAARVRGDKVPYEAKLAFSMQGNVQLELIENLYGDTIYKEQHERWGPSIHHVQVRVDDLDASMERFAAMGVDTIQSDRFKGGGGLAFVDTQSKGGILLELVQPRVDPTQEGYVDE